MSRANTMSNNDSPQNESFSSYVSILENNDEDKGNYSSPVSTTMNLSHSILHKNNVTDSIPFVPKKSISTASLDTLLHFSTETTVSKQYPTNAESEPEKVCLSCLTGF